MIESSRKYVDRLSESLKVTEIVWSWHAFFKQSKLILIALLILSSEVCNVYPRWIMSLPRAKSKVTNFAKVLRSFTRICWQLSRSLSGLSFPKKLILTAVALIFQSTKYIKSTHGRWINCFWEWSFVADIWTVVQTCWVEWTYLAPNDPCYLLLLSYRA